jgi:hypothetical protein
MKTVRPEAPELLSLKLQLSIDTRIDPYEFADWIRANRDWLNFDWFYEHCASRAKHPDHIHEIYASARMEYKRRTSLRTPNSQLASTIPIESTCASHSVAEPAGTFLQRLWRKLP